MPSIIKCFCKVNLSLKILKYSEEYKKHFLSSIFLRSSQFYDFLKITQNSSKPGIFMKYQGKWITVNNQILKKVINYFTNHYHLDLSKIRVEIIKNIPIGSGLGGGSSDAAGFIKWFYKTYKINKNKQIDYLSIARYLGSDIPFFLSNFKMAKVEGIGEKISHMKNFKIKHHIIINKVMCKTSEVFNHYKNQLKPKRNSLNDLTESAFILYPELEKIYFELKKIHKYVILSGSGSSFVVLKEKYKYE